MVFEDRTQAGRVLAGHLAFLSGAPGLVVLALPRGGVPVAYEIATRLGAPLDVLVVRKLGAPGHEEFAMGAIAAGVRVLHEETLRALDITPDRVEEVVRREEAELARRERAYRDDRPFPSLRDRTVLIVDDSLATGATMKAAVEAVRQLGPARILVAVPVASIPACREVGHLADQIVCAETPEPFHAVSLWYRSFEPTTDEEVRRLLELSAAFQAQRTEAP